MKGGGRKGGREEGGEGRKEGRAEGGKQHNRHEIVLTQFRYLDRSIINDRFLRDEGEFLIVVLIGGQQLVFHWIETDRLESSHRMRW